MRCAAAAMWAIAAIGSGATIIDDEIAAVVRRLEILTPMESVWPRIDSLRHAGELLSSAAPDRSRALREAAAKLERAADGARPEPLLEARHELEKAAAAKDRDAMERGAEKFLRAVEHSAESPEDYAWFASMRRRHDIVKGGDNPSIRVREALAELAELVRTDFEFVLADVNGKPFEVRPHGVTVVSFWATWCGPCVEEMRTLERVWRREGARIIAVTDEPEEKVRGFLRDYPVTFPVLLDAPRAMFARFGVEALPALLIVDGSGRLRARAGRVSEEELLALLRRF